VFRVPSMVSAKSIQMNMPQRAPETAQDARGKGFLEGRSTQLTH
jgi:hypothetical protein